LLGITKLIYNNKTHSSTKTLFFKTNYKQDLKMEFKVRRKGKYKRTEKFMTKMKKI